MKVTSPVFSDNQPIPRRYTGDGENVSPPLHVDDVPPGTQELAVIVEDPDAPTPEPFVHWVAYKIPVDQTDLPENLPTRDTIDEPPAAQGWNDFKKIGYGGPAPPRGHGVHHYHFRVYALDKPLELEPAQDHKRLRASMAGHILDSAEVVGTYQRLS